MQVQIKDLQPLTAPHDSAPPGSWAWARGQFLAALDPRQRLRVAALLSRPRDGGLGLRLWLRALAARGTSLPESLPPELVEVYFEDPEAVPLHDCALCGLAVPVRPGRGGYEGEPERVYFPSCPCCGGKTGLYAYWSHTTEG